MYVVRRGSCIYVRYGLSRAWRILKGCTERCTRYYNVSVFVRRCRTRGGDTEDYYYVQDDYLSIPICNYVQRVHLDFFSVNFKK